MTNLVERLLNAAAEIDAGWAEDNQPVSQGGPRHDSDLVSPRPENLPHEAADELTRLYAEREMLAKATRAQADTIIRFRALNEKLVEALSKLRWALSHRPSSEQRHYRDELRLADAALSRARAKDKETSE